MYDFTGRNALVTGASGGIGSAIAKMMHKQGAHVYISGSNGDKLKELAKELGNNCTIKQCNLSDVAACNTLLDDIEKLDILVCNAGITKDNLSIKMSDEDFDEVININLKASFILNRAAIKKMMRERYGRIINISSIVGFTGNPGQANYCASKAGIVGMTKSLAQEVASRGITINVVAPGFIKSLMTDVLSDEQKNNIMNKIPAKSLGSPEDIAHAVAFLACNESSYITGQTIHVNGGMFMA
ncbi:MAG: 3-oxoacyl-ACP reductase FabG [Rickettsiales bacterium]|nr:3-oxoacyl-ACP reductase FabG [Rickettsiales bacterium]MCA0254710.1 3-oxoacyl-ACP reductase FabG [Pseudomonadota bacterium]